MGYCKWDGQGDIPIHSWMAKTKLSSTIWTWSSKTGIPELDGIGYASKTIVDTRELDVYEPKMNYGRCLAWKTEILEQDWKEWGFFKKHNGTPLTEIKLWQDEDPYFQRLAWWFQMYHPEIGWLVAGSNSLPTTGRWFAAAPLRQICQTFEQAHQQSERQVTQLPAVCCQIFGPKIPNLMDPKLVTQKMLHFISKSHPKSRQIILKKQSKPKKTKNNGFKLWLFITASCSDIIQFTWRLEDDLGEAPARPGDMAQVEKTHSWLMYC